MNIARNSLTAPIAAIRHFTIHDGPGIRTTVFVKGCPLQCSWCHNPECINSFPQLLFHQKLCISCGRCIKVCPQGAIKYNLGNLSIDRTICQNCGKCSSVCLPRALSICGEKSKCVDEVLKEVLQDKVFYAENGGVTASGGEPLLYPDFFAELFSCLHRESIHTALDTSGAVAFEAFQKVLPETDLVLYDLKGMDSYFHTVNTGLDNKLILDNLRKVGEFGVPIEIRMPIVPGLNDSQEELEAAGEFLASIKSIKQVKLLAWHKSSDKYFSAGMTERMNVDIIPPGKREMQNAQMAISRKFPGEIIIP